MAKNTQTKVSSRTEHWTMRLPPMLRFFACVTGVFACYIVHDYLQELAFHTPKFSFGWFMTLFELAVYVISSTAQVRHSGHSLSEAKPFLREYGVLTLLIAGTQGFGSAAINYVNYPVKVVCKSSKLIPTMTLGLFIGRKYYFWEYVAAIFLVSGVVGFLLVDASASPKFQGIGLVFLGIAVVGDALTANSQEYILKKLRRPASEMIAVSNGFGMLVVLLVCVATSEILPALSLCFQNPLVPALLTAQAVSGYLGVGFYLALVESFGGAVAVTVTTCRKVFTIAISFVVFSKPFDPLYILTGALILLGIFIGLRGKDRTAH